MELAASSFPHRTGLATTSAALGAVAWMATPWIPGGGAPQPGSIESILLFFPLVAAPLALELLSRLWTEVDGAPHGLHTWARAVQPPAAALLLVSFHRPRGTAAAALFAAPWLGVAALVCAGGVAGLASRRAMRGTRASLLAAQLFLLVGAVSLFLSRLGAAPRGLSTVMVSLAAVHFHYNGVAAQLLVAATGRSLPRSPALERLQRFVMVATISGLTMLAAGKLARAPIPRFAGVCAITLGFAGLALTSTAAALRVRRTAARLLLLASAAAVVAGIALASAYGLGELAGREWIGLARMTATHGVLMSAGFTVCGLGGHLLATSDGHAPLRSRDVPS